MAGVLGAGLVPAHTDEAKVKCFGVAKAGLLFVNLVAVISYPRLFTFECPAAINDHLYWGILLLLLLVWGLGTLSVDSWVTRKPSRV
jgi:uncharacterized membrane protein YphA (DoxX/SURF4 family)